MANPRTLTHLQQITGSAAALRNAPEGKQVTLERVILEDIQNAGVLTVTPLGDNPMGDTALAIGVATSDTGRVIEIMHTYETSFEIDISGASNEASAVYRVY